MALLQVMSLNVQAAQHARLRPPCFLCLCALHTAHFYVSTHPSTMQSRAHAAGMTGVGKSVIAASTLEGLSRRKGVLPYTLNFSAQTGARSTQLQMEEKLEKKRKTRCARAGGRL